MNEELIVVKDNQVINASYKLTLTEQRIILSCIAKIDSTADLSTDEGFTIQVDEIRDLVAQGGRSGSFYEEVKRATDKLYERSIYLDDKGSKRRWIYEVTYNETEGSLTLFFSPTIIPYLSQLKGNFTKYKLAYIANFRSSHAIRIYELLVQWSSKGERELLIDELKTMLGLEGKYERVGNLIERVIKPAISDINTHSNLTVKY
ncbi:MAG TPA: RepB family plasmid replication initiator protein [Phycisphaerales bacterium]|nr:RepB family plasmid replication initiator protein [Phycisphaerales bacterium]